MYFFNKPLLLGLSLLLLSLTLTSCKGMQDDLRPSGVDRRPPAATSTNQSALTLTNTQGQTRSFPAAVLGRRGAVLYFTMWCPICAMHTNHLLKVVIPQFPAIDYYLIDFVSGSVERARQNQASSGYANAPFEVLVDHDQQALNTYHGAMGIVVVLDSSGKVRLDERFKDGTKLVDTLSAL